jgi:hypothetical protein
MVFTQYNGMYSHALVHLYLHALIELDPLTHKTSDSLETSNSKETSNGGLRGTWNGLEAWSGREAWNGRDTQ